MNVTLLFPLGSWIVRAISFVINMHLERGANDLRAYQPFLWGLSGTQMSETCWVTLYILFIKIIDNLQLSKINNMHADVHMYVNMYVRSTLFVRRTVVRERI